MYSCHSTLYDNSDDCVATVTIITGGLHLRRPISWNPPSFLAAVSPCTPRNERRIPKPITCTPSPGEISDLNNQKRIFSSIAPTPNDTRSGTRLWIQIFRNWIFNKNENLVVPSFPYAFYNFKWKRTNGLEQTCRLVLSEEFYSNRHSYIGLSLSVRDGALQPLRTRLFSAISCQRRWLEMFKDSECRTEKSSRALNLEKIELWVSNLYGL